MALCVADIGRLFETRGHLQYDGEPVTQLEHALQCAHLAEQARQAGAPVPGLAHFLAHVERCTGR